MKELTQVEALDLATSMLQHLGSRLRHQGAYSTFMFYERLSAIESARNIALRDSEKDKETLGVHLGCCIEETPSEAEGWG